MGSIRGQSPARTGQRTGRPTGAGGEAPWWPSQPGELSRGGRQGRQARRKEPATPGLHHIWTFLGHISTLPSNREVAEAWGTLQPWAAALELQPQLLTGTGHQQPTSLSSPQRWAEAGNGDLFSLALPPPQNQHRKASYATILATALQPPRPAWLPSLVQRRPGPAQGGTGLQLPLSLQAQDALLTNTWGQKGRGRELKIAQLATEKPGLSPQGPVIHQPWARGTR